MCFFINILYLGTEWVIVLFSLVCPVTKSVICQVVIEAKDNNDSKLIILMTNY